jgi:hypothetical protein
MGINLTGLEVVRPPTETAVQVMSQPLPEPIRKRSRVASHPIVGPRAIAVDCFDVHVAGIEKGHDRIALVEFESHRHAAIRAQLLRPWNQLHGEALSPQNRFRPESVVCAKKTD